MKKITLLLMLICVSTSAFAMDKTFSFGVGFLSPKDAESSVFWTLNRGFKFDEKISLDISIGFFHKTITDKSLLETKTNETNTSTVSKVESKNTFSYVPIMGNALITFPINDSCAFVPYAKGGIGYGSLFTSIKKENIDEYKTYVGFNWQLGGGVSYKLGKKSKLFAEIFYNSVTLSSDEETLENYTIVEEVDMSGMGMLFGINVEF